jgi:hypothetical protein
LVAAAQHECAVLGVVRLQRHTHVRVAAAVAIVAAATSQSPFV